jgi:hypothetical protein
MHWLRSHPFALLFAGAGLVVLIIVIGINSTRIPSSFFTGPSVVAVSGGNTLQDPGISQPHTEYPPTQNASTLPAREDEAGTTTTNPPIVNVAQTPVASAPASSSSAQSPETDYQSILSSIYNTSASSNSSTKIDPSATDAIIKQVYALIPSTYSLPLPVSTNRTTAQQTLYAYGNQAGLTVLSFENAHADMAGVLKTWFTDRKDSSTVAPAETIANDMIATGDALDRLPNVPAAAAPLNHTLAQAYRDAGQDLLKVLAGGSDSHIADSMKTYDTTADNFTKSYLDMVDFFQKNNVLFSSTDMGSAFSPAGSSL